MWCKLTVLGEVQRFVGARWEDSLCAVLEEECVADADGKYAGFE